MRFNILDVSLTNGHRFPAFFAFGVLCLFVPGRDRSEKMINEGGFQGLYL